MTTARPVPRTARRVPLLLAALLALPVAGLTAPADAAPTKDLVLTLTSTSEPVSGDKVTFTGTAPNSLSGAAAKLQRRVGKKGDWVKVASTRVAADGTYALTGGSTGVGSNKWRVLAKKAGVLHVSNIVKTTVYSWFYLYDLSMVDSDGDMYRGSVAIGGQNFAKSLYADPYYDGQVDWAEWNVSYRCKTFTASIGLDDDSESGSNASFNAYLDGAETALGTMGLGPASKVEVDVSGRLRLKLETVNNNDTDSYPALGNARVLCSGKP